ncbi:Hypothetical protein CAP_7023 [Chondromyces apiculatus DSM 436]|uniref:Uncharacterized protein n=1 Tax=Chondromyces apiculatus DSM 436 TaxID=1192034 RepID=A0A017THC5_9BACT|nr:Hypothetical protein CAP_7023 [Chondromyces apiculatus DSM 436]
MAATKRNPPYRPAGGVIHLPPALSPGGRGDGRHVSRSPGGGSRHAG